jgi:hypothetical protein
MKENPALFLIAKMGRTLPRVKKPGHENDHHDNL